ncbi:hypothetical protein [Streptomyces sp. NPDC018693]|uniref:hypothetical protein n=1 Tax=unclassified Streptomyces TaxID=2593676 RepID=UPI00379B6231
MSRETDSPSSGPNGRGGAAYPSGTPPYGTPVVSDGGPDAGRSAAQPEERKTETTLTTRIRINIPGSRPIPPVVVRKPVGDAEGNAGDDTGTDAQTTGTMGVVGATTAAPATPRPPAAESAPAAEEKTSDWFAPRKSAANKGGQGSGSTNGAGMPGGSGAPAPAAPSAPSTPSASPAGPAAGAPRPGAGAGRPGGVVGSMSAPGGPRSGTKGGGTGAKGGAGLPGGATGGPVAPGHGGGTGSFDVTEALTASSRPGAAAGAPEANRDDLPYFSEDAAHQNPGGRPAYGSAPNGPNGLNSANGLNGANGPNGQGHAAPAGYEDFSAYEDFQDYGGPQNQGGGRRGPAGPTTGPVTGDGPMVPPATGDTRPPGPAGPGAPARQGAPGGVPGAPLPGGGLSDDTAILTPQKPAPEPGPNGGFPRPDNVSGHTVTSGIPVVPPSGAAPGASLGAPSGPGTSPAGGPRQQTAPKPATDTSAAQQKKNKKGRSKLVLLGGVLVVAAAGVYGAGLLMNHSDVPKGTTVLGVDIGGGTRDDAVKKLNDAFDERVGQALKLSVDGDTVTLKPDQAGLQFDMQATVDAAAKSDYNPVSVVGSLFGQKREVEPAMPVDEEKLQAALQAAAGGAGSAVDGTIRFESGKAVAVYGKAGKGIDASAATGAVEAAYRTQVETGTSTPVQVPTTTKEPTVSNAEVDRMMKEFAEPAMSAKVTLRAETGQEISFSPAKSLWKFLQVKAVDGKLVDSYDEAALKELYGGTFDGVLITRGTGQKTPVTVQDVISALRPALTSTTNRVAVIETDPS